MTTVLVTGGFGFLGSHLVEELLRDPLNEVHVVDDLSTSPLDLDAFLSKLPSRGNLSYSLGSIAKYCRNSDGRRFHQIYHLASVVGPAGVLPHAGRIIKSIVDNAYYMIERALRDDAKLLDVSTSEVYGGGIDGFCGEDTPKIIPPHVSIRLEYAIGKMAAEAALINTCRVKPLRACVIRPFNIAGPRQSPTGGFVLPRFVAQALRGEPLTVFGDGTQVRAFTHVKDMVSALQCVMEKGATGEVYNAGNPANRLTIRELAERVVQITGSVSPIEFVDPKTIFGPLYEETSDKCPVADKLMKELGWRPSCTIEDIIRGALADYLERSGKT